MTELRVVSVADLKPVLDVFNGLSWPVTFDEFPSTSSGSAVEFQFKSGGATSPPVSKQMAPVGKLDGELSRFRFRISDTLAEAGPISNAILRDAFVSASQVVSACMGFAPTGAPRVIPGSVCAHR